MTFISDSAGIFLASDVTKGIRFQMWPDSIDDAKSVNWNNIDVIGRSEPLVVYHSSGPRELAFTLFFSASVDEKDEIGTAKVQEKVNFIKSLSYPVRAKETGFSTSPPLILLIVGDLIYTRCILKSYNVAWAGAWEFDYISQLRTNFSGFAGRPGLALRGSAAFNSLTEDTRPLVSLPQIAKVSIVLQCINSVPLTMEDVVANGDKINNKNYTSRDALLEAAGTWTEDDPFKDLEE